MKILVIGDSHGNIANLKHVMGFAKKIKAEAVIHTGDWNNLESVNTVLSFRIPLYSVLGNADIDPKINQNLKIKSQKYNSKFLKFEIDGVKIGVLHSIKNLKLIKNYKLKIKNLDIVFCGHYHSQKMWEQDGVKIVRPGALEKEVYFAVYDTKTNEVELIHE